MHEQHWHLQRNFKIALTRNFWWACCLWTWKVWGFFKRFWCLYPPLKIMLHCELWFFLFVVQKTVSSLYFHSERHKLHIVMVFAKWIFYNSSFSSQLFSHKPALIWMAKCPPVKHLQWTQVLRLGPGQLLGVCPVILELLKPRKYLLIACFKYPLTYRNSFNYQKNDILFCYSLHLLLG